MAFGWNPYGPNASLNLRTVAAEMGSLPLRMALTLDRSSGGSPSLGSPRAAAWSNAKFGRHRDDAAGVAGLARHLPHPAAGPADERGRGHEGEVVADHRRQHRRDQAHVVEERQPGHAAVALFALQRLDDLDHVGGQVQMGDLHTRRDAGRAGGVLQVRDGVGVDVSTGSQVAPTSSGTASTAMTRGRSLAGRLRKNLRTPSAASVVVRMADGWQSSSTACRRPTWPGSDGSNSGTAMRPA